MQSDAYYGAIRGEAAVMIRCRKLNMEKDGYMASSTPIIIYDVHTHDLQRENAVVNLPSGAEIPVSGIYSVGIHPWDADEADGEALAWLRYAAHHHNVVAIGETGFDALRGGDMEHQEALFREHAALSRQYGKPLIIHNVRGTDRIIRLHREWRPAEPWIIHGFRGKPELARQLIREGLYLSIGEKFNSRSLQEIPTERLLLESDDSAMRLNDIAARAGVSIRNVSQLFFPSETHPDVD